MKMLNRAKLYGNRFRGESLRLLLETAAIKGMLWWKVPLQMAVVTNRSIFKSLTSHQDSPRM